LRNPGYFKLEGQSETWKAKQRHYNQHWRNSHKNLLKKYALEHKIERRNYMREYMKRRRQEQLINREKS
jgi:hypothetical protein